VVVTWIVIWRCYSASTFSVGRCRRVLGQVYGGSVSLKSVPVYKLDPVVAGNHEIPRSVARNEALLMKTWSFNSVGL
jgi:hypothetical protein